MEYTYDNSAANLRNPQLPPARVFWGQRSRDEMGDLWFQLLAQNEPDRALLNAQISRKMTAEDVIGYETLLRVDPKDIELHNDVAVLYLSLNQPSAAVRHFQASVDLNLASAAAHFNLGTALTAAGRLAEGVAEFRAALARRPDYAAAHNNLGRALLSQGQTATALEHLEQAVRLDPANLSAFFNLSEAYAATGAFDRAVDALDRALRLSPGEPLASQLRQRREMLAAKVPKFQGSRVPRFEVPGSTMLVLRTTDR
jgi:Tfp pilus assembly protein PilF